MHENAQKHEKNAAFKNEQKKAKIYAILTSLNYVHLYARYF